MRKLWLLAGIVLLAVGLLLAVIPTPLASVAPPSVVAPDKVLVIHDQAPIDVIQPAVSYSIRWNASPNTALAVWSCGSSSACTNVSGTPLVNVPSSAGGTFTFSGKANVYYGVLNLGNGTATLSVSYSGPVLGAVASWAALIIGILLIVTGAILGPPGSTPPKEGSEPPSEPDAPGGPSPPES
ncbi:MAG: hypothetical protein L3K03_03340 [Thermoplasmata archaeon]|nr:hypothetical protein [Thermoplasmata archaeon]